MQRLKIAIFILVSAGLTAAPITFAAAGPSGGSKPGVSAKEGEGYVQEQSATCESLRKEKQQKYVKMLGGSATNLEDYKEPGPVLALTSNNCQMSEQFIPGEAQQRRCANGYTEAIKYMLAADNALGENCAKLKEASNAMSKCSGDFVPCYAAMSRSLKEAKDFLRKAGEYERKFTEKLGQLFVATNNAARAYQAKMYEYANTLRKLQADPNIKKPISFSDPAVIAALGPKFRMQMAVSSITDIKPEALEERANEYSSKTSANSKQVTMDPGFQMLSSSATQQDAYRDSAITSKQHQMDADRLEKYTAAMDASQKNLGQIETQNGTPGQKNNSFINQNAPGPAASASVHTALAPGAGSSPLPETNASGASRAMAFEAPSALANAEAGSNVPGSLSPSLTRQFGDFPSSAPMPTRGGFANLENAHSFIGDQPSPRSAPGVGGNEPKTMAREPTPGHVPPSVFGNAAPTAGAVYEISVTNHTQFRTTSSLPSNSPPEIATRPREDVAVLAPVGSPVLPMPPSVAAHAEAFADKEISRLAATHAMTDKMRDQLRRRLLSTFSRRYQQNEEEKKKSQAEGSGNAVGDAIKLVNEAKDTDQMSREEFRMLAGDTAQEVKRLMGDDAAETQADRQLLTERTLFERVHAAYSRSTL